jgi:hypothetical protein
MIVFYTKFEHEPVIGNWTERRELLFQFFKREPLGGSMGYLNRVPAA